MSDKIFVVAFNTYKDQRFFLSSLSSYTTHYKQIRSFLCSPYAYFSAYQMLILEQ